MRGARLEHQQPAMSTSHRQQRQLRRMAARLRQSDPELDAMFGIFGRLYRGQELAAWEQKCRMPSGPGWRRPWRAGMKALRGLRIRPREARAGDHSGRQLRPRRWGQARALPASSQSLSLAGTLAP